MPKHQYLNPREHLQPTGLTRDFGLHHLLNHEVTDQPCHPACRCWQSTHEVSRTQQSI